MKGSARKVTRIEPSYLGLGSLFSNARDAIIVGDPSTGQILLWNNAAEKIFGFTSQEVLGKLLEDLVPDRLKEQHRAGLARFAATGHGPLVDTGKVVELPAIRKDGKEITVELTLTPLTSKRLSGNFAMAIVRDVTDRVEAQKELELVNDELKRVNELSRDFVQIASHDLRSPMTAILGFATTLRRRLTSSGDEEGAEFASIIERQTRFLGRIVDDLMTITGIESGQVHAVIQPVPILDAINQAVEFYSQSSEIAVDVRHDVKVLSDPDHLRRILANYVGNAVKYGLPPVTVKAEAVGSFVEVTVCDEGEGIPLEFMPHLFEKFARGDSPASRKEKGTGLGLSIVKGLAEVSGGEVWYTPNHPKGSCFGVRLPKSPE